MIISILAAALLGVAAVAGETAREATSRNMIARIHTLLMDHLETYSSRRVKLQKPVLDVINDPARNLNSREKGLARAEARLYALREMMLIEMPDRWSDVLLNQVGMPALAPIYLDVSRSRDGRTELANVYLRRYRRIASISFKNSLTGEPNTQDEILDNQGAECLYLLIMNATGDGEARNQFPDSSIGDTDGDGAPELLDGWGNPIDFLRWAPGFESDIQNNAGKFHPPKNDPNDPYGPADDSAWRAAANADHDPFDMFRVEEKAFRLVPLVFSNGRDEADGLRQRRSHVTWLPDGSSIAPTWIGAYRRLQPWAAVSNDAYLGEANSNKEHTDNIHHHLIDER